MSLRTSQIPGQRPPSPSKFEFEKVETTLAIKFSQINSQLLNFDPKTSLRLLKHAVLHTPSTDTSNYIEQQAQHEINLQKKELLQELTTLTNPIKDSNNETHKSIIKLLRDTLADCHMQLDQHKPHLIKTITEAYEASK